MKKKVVTSLLILAVLALWGTIIWKVLAAVGDDENNGMVKEPARVSSVKIIQDTISSIDTAKLALNYPDPFRTVNTSIAGVESEVSIKKLVTDARAARNVTNIIATKPPEINWSFITYNGYIGHPGNKKLSSLIAINNQTYTLAEGETTAGVRLIKNMRDSIKVTYNGHTHTFPLITK